MSSADEGAVGGPGGSAAQARGAYPPAAFRETRSEVLEAFICANPFGQLITTGPTGLHACGAPFVLRHGSGGVYLEAHVARANPLASRDGAEALVLFQGPHAYIRPAWYPAKARDGRVVPTWNYIVAQARGVVSIVEDAAWLRALLDDLTAQQESGFSDPWSPADAPADYVDRLLRGIVGVRLDPVELEGVWKLNQNHPRENRLGVVAGLSGMAHPDAAEIAQAMIEGEGGD
ncbi:MAG TPA: FMN-binding negative transcriptional regulator [Caulobacteraceae bacterium]|jgi:transcriptional regulator|nr:FMN-binding negative transcriptional regulator [Caulobacteraceae bacterium]